jgi:hypothetical protein
VVSFTDDYSKVPPIYRESVKEVSTPRKERTAPSEAPAEKMGVNVQSTGTARQVPPISQSLVPEGDFALKLATALKLGTPETEAQAEDILTSVGIAPKNGWIADYPMTPIIIGQVQNALIAAAALKKLPMGKDEALQAFQGLNAEFGLAIAPGPEQYAEDQPPSGSEYVPPPEIENYYYEQGPPIITYYPPPWDYNYLYGWVPYPFWFSGFFFPGFFVLNDFHHFHHDHHFHQGHHLISNHFIDPKTHASLRVDPTTRTRGTAATRTAEGRRSKGLHLRRLEKGLRQSPTEVLQRQGPPLSLGQEVEDSGEPSRLLGRAAGHPANQAILEDNIETFKGQGLVQSGLLAEASIAHQAGLLVHLLWAGEVLPAYFMVAVVTLEASIVVAAASVAHQAGLLVHLLLAGEVLPADFMVAVVSLEAPMVVAALGALTEEGIRKIKE